MLKNFELKSRVLQARTQKYFMGGWGSSVRLRAVVEGLLNGIQMQKTQQSGRPWRLPEELPTDVYLD